MQSRISHGTRSPTSFLKKQLHEDPERTIDNFRWFTTGTPSGKTHHESRPILVARLDSIAFNEGRPICLRRLDPLGHEC